MTQERPNYAEIDYWRKYQPFLPERARIREDRAPVEEWWPWRGADIHLDRYPSSRLPVTVILVHGAGGYGRLLAPYGLLLCDHGFEVVAPDLPGYGISQIPSRMFTFEHWLDCLTELVQAEKARNGHTIALFGLSLGGFLAYCVAARESAVAGVIATTLADPRLPFVRDQLVGNWLVSRMAVPFLPITSALMGPLRLPIKWFSPMHRITNDPQVVQLFWDDPYGGGNWTPIGFMASVFRLPPPVEPEAFDRCPVLLAHPAEDRWTTVEASRLFFDRIKGPRELVLLEGCGHYPIEEPGFTQLEKATIAFLDRLAHS